MEVGLLLSGHEQLRPEPNHGLHGVWGLGYRASGTGFRVSGLKFRAYCLLFRALGREGSGLRV